MLLDGILTTAQQGPHLTRDFPLPRDIISQRLVEEWVINEDDYSPLAIGALHPDNPTVLPGEFADADSYFLAKETQRVRIFPGVFKFTRIWNNIWEARDDWETYSFSHFEFRGAFPYVSHSVIATGAPSGGEIILTLGNDHTLIVGDSVLLTVSSSWTSGSNTFSSSAQVARTVTATTAADKITVEDVPTPDWADDQNILACLDLGGPVRQAFTKIVNSRVALDYWTLGETEDPNDLGNPIVTPQDIPIIPRYTIRNTDDAEVPFLSDRTTPTQATYQALIDAGTEIVAEASQINEIEGNQYERRTLYVVAA